MKSTYKLIGLYWDGKAEAERLEDLLPFDPSYLDSSAPLCLFDFVAKKRNVYLSVLLGANNQEEFDSVAKGLEGCDYIAVVVDYCPVFASIVHRRFYEHRALQVLGQVHKAVPKANLVMMALPETAGAA